MRAQFVSILLLDLLNAIILDQEICLRGCVLAFLHLFYMSSFKHFFAGFVSKLLETDGLRAVVQYDIVGVGYAGLHERINFYASLC